MFSKKQMSAVLILGLSVVALAADGKAFLSETAASFANTGPIKAEDLNAVLGRRISCTSVKNNGDISSRILNLFSEAPNLYKHVLDTSACSIVACISGEQQEFRLNGSGELVAASSLKNSSYISGETYDETEIRLKRASNGDWIGQLFVTKKKYVLWGPRYEKIKGYLYCNAAATTAQAAAQAAQPAAASPGEQKAAPAVAAEEGSSPKQVASQSPVTAKGGAGGALHAK